MKTKWLEIRNIEISAAHRLMNHPGKCKNLHGHNYFIPKLVICGKLNPDTGMVVDFKDIMRVFNELDHKTILYKDDPLVKNLTEHKQDLFLLDGHPTVENIATYFKGKLEKMGVMIIKLTLHETKDCACSEKTMEKDEYD